MKTLLLACLMLVAVPVGAEEAPIDWSGHHRVTLSYFPLEEDLGAAIVSAASQHTACLARMEEALRAVEIFIPKTPAGVMEHRSPLWAFKYADVVANAINAYQATKRECWRQP